MALHKRRCGITDRSGGAEFQLWRKCCKRVLQLCFGIMPARALRQRTLMRSSQARLISTPKHMCCRRTPCLENEPSRTISNVQCPATSHLWIFPMLQFNALLSCLARYKSGALISLHTLRFIRFFHTALENPYSTLELPFLALSHVSLRYLEHSFTLKRTFCNLDRHGFGIDLHVKTYLVSDRGKVFSIITVSSRLCRRDATLQVQSSKII